MISFGKRLRAQRLERHLNQKDFKVHGVTQSDLSKIESGQLQPSAEKIERIAQALGVPAVDLVAGTDLQGKYFSSKLTPGDIANHDDQASVARSEKMLAVEEAYKRIQLFHDLLYNDPGDKWFRATVDNDAHYQHAARIMRRTIEAAEQYDPALNTRMQVPSSLLDQRPLLEDRDRAAIHDIRFSIEKSLAYIRSLILEYPEADHPETRARLVKVLGLEKIDSHLGRFKIHDSVDSVTWDGFENEFAIEDEIPF